jgi:hypothetical protein
MICCIISATFAAKIAQATWWHSDSAKTAMLPPKMTAVVLTGASAETNTAVGVVVEPESGAAATLDAESTETEMADKLADVLDMHEINLFGSKIKVSRLHNGTLFFTHGASRRAGTVQVPKNLMPLKKKRGNTPLPIPDICDRCVSGHPIDNRLA